MIMFLFVAAFLASGLMIDAFHFLNSSMSHLSSQVKQLHISVLRTLIMQVRIIALSVIFKLADFGPSSTVGSSHGYATPGQHIKIYKSRSEF